MLVRNGQTDVLRLDAGGLVVGLLPQADYTEQSVVLSSGDLLVAYTDGISEAMTHDDEEWGEERMLIAARQSEHSSAEQIMQEVFRAAAEFTAGAPQHDDMTVLIMKLT